MEMGFGEVDPDILWAEVEKLNSRTTPSLLNTQNDGPREVNPSRNLESSIADPGLRNELAATTTTLVQDSVGAVLVATNKTQNTAPTFNFGEAAASSIRGNPPAPPLIVEDRNQLPQLSPHSSAPLMNVTQSNYPSPSVVGLIHGGAVSSTQGQDMTPMSYYNQFSHMQNNMIHDLGPHNQYSTSSQLLVPNILVNNNHNGIHNQYSSSYPTLFQQNPVAVGAGINTGITNEQFMTNQRSPLFPLQNDQAINSRAARNSPWSLPVPNQRNENIPFLDNLNLQRRSSTLYGTTAPPSGLTNSSASNSIVLALSNTEGTSSGSSETSRLLRPERVSGTQLHEVVPVSSANLVIAQSGNGLPQSSSSRAQPSEIIQKILNRRFEVLAASSGVLQNTSLNLQNERTGSTGTQNAGIAQEILNANPINPFPAPNPRQVFNAVYDPTYQSIGLPVDPHLRLFKQLKEK